MKRRQYLEAGIALADRQLEFDDRRLPTGEWAHALWGRLRGDWVAELGDYLGEVGAYRRSPMIEEDWS